jgi:site-specific DNA-adenine methylase
MQSVLQEHGLRTDIVYTDPKYPLLTLTKTFIEQTETIRFLQNCERVAV